LFTIGKHRKFVLAALPIIKPVTRLQTRAYNNLVSEPSLDEMEQRIERMEKELGAMDERIQKDMEKMFGAQKHMEEMLGALLTKRQGNREEDQSNSASSSGPESAVIPTGLNLAALSQRLPN
jgi:pantoate kinase